MEFTLKKIDKLLANLQQLQPIQAAYQQKLDEKIRLEFNYNSNHIEGNTLTYGETELLLIFDKTRGNHELREYEEMKAHDVAFKLVKEWAADKERPLTETGIKNLHEILLVRPFWKEAITPDGTPTRKLIKAGTYKEYPNSVRLQTGEIFHYTSPTETPIQMGELVQWFRDEEDKEELHPVELAALLHYKFVRIHPFDDGNGRISRLLMNYALLQYNLPPIIIKSTDKKNYLFALNQADAGDMKAFINYIGEQAIWSLGLNIKAVKGETLEEEEDFMKEVSVWKKSVLPKGEIIKNNEAIIALYNGSISELFNFFIDKMKIAFFDLFEDTKIHGYVNESITNAEGKTYLDTYIAKLQETKTEKSGLDIKEALRSISVRIDLYNPRFKNSGTLIYYVILTILFTSKSYIIQNNGITLREKNYNEGVSKLEQKEIVKTIVEKNFSQIKTA